MAISLAYASPLARGFKRANSTAPAVNAKVEDGILTITMPKTEPKQKVTKAIEVS